jgi:calcineurin-like phosphoesterase family protein
MSNIFLISDTHFKHESCWTKFTCDDGSPMRPVASSAAEGDELMIQRWNSVVRTQDKVYHLGDVFISTKAEDFKLLERLNGTKILIKGNHDMAKLSIYAQYFKDVRAVHKLDHFVLTHVPLHPDSVGRWKGGNIHGHTHYRRMKVNGLYDDPRYHCVCVEQIDYTPLALEDLKSRLARRAEN